MNSIRCRVNILFFQSYALTIRYSRPAVQAAVYSYAKHSLQNLMCFIMSSLFPHLFGSVQQTADHGLLSGLIVLRCFTVLPQATTENLICALKHLWKACSRGMGI